ncbi:MAG: hypothetical protein ACK5D5_07130 [Bacteroidota bacterium]|jgi:hypothetical protein
MSPNENLHDAIGMMAYVIAFADGKIQPEEKLKWEEIVSEEIKRHDENFTISSISFKLLEKDKLDADTIYGWAMREFRNNSHYLSPELKLTALRVVEKVAKAFPPATSIESAFIHKFRADLTPLVGDPIFYNG